MNPSVKTFFIYTFTVIMTGLGIASYWIPELINYVAAYAILNIVYGVILIIVLGLAYLLKSEMLKNPNFVKCVIKVRDTLGNPFKVIINHTSKIVGVGILIYHGWVFTAVMLGIVSVFTVMAMKGFAKIEITEDIQ
ncbi:TMhelix containing protein [Vibrio phage 1.187.O._10N.286.49.F1]|nr:TMhelix containing protein [Vibrio phage 1.187.O._10N.286.49.F1]